MATDPEWPTAAEWLAGASSDAGALVVAGVPLAAGAVTPSAYDRAPAAVRARLARLSVFHAESGTDLRAVPVFRGLIPRAWSRRRST